MIKNKLSTTRIVELCLVFFITILSFSVGTYVGKEYTKNQARLSSAGTDENTKDLAQLEVVPQDEIHAENKLSQVGAALTDEEIAQMAEELNSEDETDTEHEVKNSSQEHSEKIVQVVEDNKSIKEIDLASNKAKVEPAKSDSVRENQAKTTAATKDTKTDKMAAHSVKQKTNEKNSDSLAREVASLSKKTNNMAKAQNTAEVAQQELKKPFYTVQVGSFRTLDEANKVSESLKARGYRATHAKATVNGQIWYRVQVGLFDSLSEAQVYKNELMEKNRLTSAIIQKIDN